MMQPVKVQRAESYLRRIVFWPVFAVVVLLLLLDAWQDINALQQEQAYRAQRIADFLAISASQEGSTSQDFSIFQAQVQRVLRSADVLSIQFIRAQPALVDQVVRVSKRGIGKRVGCRDTRSSDDRGSACHHRHGGGRDQDSRSEAGQLVQFHDYLVRLK